MVFSRDSLKDEKKWRILPELPLPASAGRGQSGPGAELSPRTMNLQLFADGEDKTEEPTPHRRREARKRGQVMKSMEVNAAVNMLGMVFFFVIFWRYYYRGFTSMLSHFLREMLCLPLDDLSFN